MTDIDELDILIYSCSMNAWSCVIGQMESSKGKQAVPVLFAAHTAVQIL